MVQDGRFLVEMSPDNMLAKGTFIPGVGEGRPLTLADVDYELRAAGVSQGIDWDLVNRMIQKSAAETQIIREVVIARGIKSRPAVQDCLVFHPAIQNLDKVFLPPEKLAALSAEGEQESHQSAGKLDDQGNIDFRETQGLFIIHEGQLLARHRNAVEGIPGTTVTGGYVPFITLAATKMDPGTNVEQREDGLYAQKNGRFAWNGHSFWIEETLELAEEVGYKTGNIRFPGNLILKAGIKDRFKVWVGGNLGAAAVLDAYEIFCGGSLEAKAGIIGRSKGLVRVKEHLLTRFVEHCDIEVLGNVELELASLNSTIYCLGELKVGEKGRLVGGHIQARKGITAFNIGNASGVHTVVCAGENYVTHRMLDYARDKLVQLQPILAKVEEKYHRTNEASLMIQAKRLREETDRYQTQIAEIIDKLEDQEDALVTALGTVFPGVVVEICRVQLLVNKELRGVRFHLDKASGKILVESLGNK